MPPNIINKSPPIYIHILAKDAFFIEADELAVETCMSPLPPETSFDAKELAVETCMSPLPVTTTYDAKEMAVEVCFTPV